MIYFSSFEADREFPVFYIDINELMQVLIDCYFDIGFCIRLFVIKINNTIDFDRIKFIDLYLLSGKSSVSLHMICCLDCE